MAAPAPSFEARLAALRADWQAQLPGRLGELRQAAQACRAAPSDAAALEDLHRRVHMLAGSAGTFGLPDLSRQARAVEHGLEALMERPARTAADFATVQAALDALPTSGEA